MKTFKEWIDHHIKEMAIGKYELRGDWDTSKKIGDDVRAFNNPGGTNNYSSKDMKLVSGKSGIERIKNRWLKTKNTWDLYFVRSNIASKFSELGEVDSNWIKTNLQEDIQANPNAISIIYTGNVAGDRIPMTPWILAHRAAHTLFEGGEGSMQSFALLLSDVLKKSTIAAYGIPSDLFNGFTGRGSDSVLGILNSIGTMKSSTKNSIDRPAEFVHELVAQFLISGRIQFNSLPKNLLSSGTYHDNPDALMKQNIKRDLSRWEDENPGVDIHSKFSYQFPSGEWYYGDDEDETHHQRLMAPYSDPLTKKLKADHKVKEIEEEKIKAGNAILQASIPELESSIQKICDSAVGKIYLM